MPVFPSVTQNIEPWVEDEFAWSVQQLDNSVDNRMVADSRLSQDYDDIDYTSGNLVSFHTSLAR